MSARVIDDPAGCLLVALRVRHADADLCAEKLHALHQRLEQAEGFRSLDTIRRDGGLGTDYYSLARFDSVEALEKWRASKERRELLGGIEELAITDISREQAAGSNIWFRPIGTMPSTPKAPPLWKRWLLSMLAVYPALVLLVALLKPVTSLLPQALGLFIVAFILTGLTTAFIVPWLSRRLQGWLTS